MIRLREARVEALLGLAIPRDEQATILERLGFGVAEARRRARRHRAALAAQRRHARGRPRRGGRAHLGLREAPDHAAVAARGERAARAGAAAAAPGRGRAAGRRRLRDPRLELRRAGPRREALDPGRRPARAGGASSPTRCRRTSRCCARACSGRCSTTSSATARAGNEDVRLWQYGAIYLARDPRRRQRRGAAGRAGPRPPARPSASTSRALLTGHLRPPTWREAEPAAGRLLRRQGRARPR